MSSVLPVSPLIIVVASHVMRLQLLRRPSSRCSTSGVSGVQAGVGNGSGQLVHSAEGSGCGACRGGTDFGSAAFLRRSFRRKHVWAFSSNGLLSCSEARRGINRSPAEISITAVPKFLREELFQYPIRRAPALHVTLYLQIEGFTDSCLEGAAIICRRAVLGHLLHRSSVWTKAQLLNQRVCSYGPGLCSR